MNEDRNWEKIFKLPFSLTKSTNCRWFQMRVNHRILATNTFLHKLGIRDNNKCSFCTDQPETLIHLFCTCPSVSSFWQDTFCWLKNSCHHILELNPSPEEILSGIINPRKSDRTLNFILLSGKQFIYANKLKNTQPHLQQFKPWLKLTYDSERYIAFKNCEWSQFNKKWLPYKILFDNT